MRADKVQVLLHNKLIYIYWQGLNFTIGGLSTSCPEYVFALPEHLKPSFHKLGKVTPIITQLEDFEAETMLDQKNQAATQITLKSKSYETGRRIWQSN